VVLHVEAEARDGTFAVLVDLVRLWLLFAADGAVTR